MAFFLHLNFQNCVRIDFVPASPGGYDTRSCFFSDSPLPFICLFFICLYVLLNLSDKILVIDIY